MCDRTMMTVAAAVLATAAMASPGVARDGCTGGTFTLESDVASLLPPDAIEWFIVDVKVVAPDDIWVVGTYDAPGIGGLYQAVDQLSLTLHYDGTHWSFVTSPNPTNPVGERSIELNAVDGISPTVVFAAGDYQGAMQDTPDTFVSEWDGDGWVHLPSPGVSGFGAQGHLFEDTVVIDAQNIWFGGSTEYGSGTSLPYMVHFDGETFTDHLLPRAPDTIAAHLIRSISALSADDIWVAGDYGGNAPGVGSSYVARGAGSSWAHVPTPHLGFGEIVYAIEAIAPDDVWICGRYQVSPPEGGAVITHPLFLHFDGSEWTQFDAPGFGFDLVALGPDDVYAGARTFDYDPALLHWDGIEWRIAAELPSDAGPFWSLDHVGDCEFVLITGDRIYRYESAPRPGDVDGDGAVDVDDLLAVIQAWGVCDDCGACPADLDDSCDVNVDDLVMVLTGWTG